jgi:hypothetical protein
MVRECGERWQRQRAMEIMRWVVEKRRGEKERRSA